MRILIIEDEPTLQKTIAKILEEFGHQVDMAENIKDGKYFLEIRHYNLIILSHILSDGDAVELLPSIKSISPKVSIIVTASKADRELEIKAFKRGADDFIVKPIDLGIFMARIEARLCFWNSHIINIGHLSIDPIEERVLFKNKEIDLKGKPFVVLTHLALHHNQIVSKDQLLHAIWEEPELVTPNVIEVAINQIRLKLDKSAKIKTIETIRRKGYRFCYK